MLEVKDLKKYYKTKGGVEVHALDGVSIEFPETGMVFLLGKSGSGKSTLLNVAGGLDRPDSGEVIVKGKSSKDFSQADFDSYRNTFVGFVFQEYNILNEFNVETNIGLALELQGKKNDKKTIEELLKTVDLQGLGKRKPNTLSGGQKQRIAIARALIKQPEIIMADEPTGALDSNTGKQVLDTLKKLSETKLVIIVSHDRDFAEQYADRIIELKDGKVLVDHSKTLTKPVEISENVRKINENTIQIKDISKLSDAEAGKLFKQFKGDGEVIISGGKESNEVFKKIVKISDDGSQESFKETDTSNINIVKYDGKDTKFIKSRLPLKHAFKLGGSNLKIKPGRLAFTMFLSVIAFTLFGVLSTLMLYNPAYSYASAAQNEAYKSFVLEKKYNVNYQTIRVDNDGKEELDYEYVDRKSTNISKSDIEKLNTNSLGLKFAGYYQNKVKLESSLANDTQKLLYSERYCYGLSDCGDNYLKDNGFNLLVGSYPTNSDEVAISDYVYYLYQECGYRNPINAAELKINKPQDMIGLTIKATLNGGYTNKEIKLKVTGIYETEKFYLDPKYDILKESDTSSVSERELKEIKDSFSDVYSSSFSGLLYVSSDFYDPYSVYLASQDADNRNYLDGLDYFGYEMLDSDYYFIFQLDENKDNYFPYNEWTSFPAMPRNMVVNQKEHFTFMDNEGNELSDFPEINDGEAYLNAYSSEVLTPIAKMFFTDISTSFGFESFVSGKDGLLYAGARYFSACGYYYADTLNAYYSDFDFDPAYSTSFTCNDIKALLAAYNEFAPLYATGDPEYMKEVHALYVDRKDIKFDICYFTRILFCSFLLPYRQSYR